MAKKILKDPNLNTLANRKFNGTVDQKNDRKMIVEGAQIHEILEQADEKKEEFECEIERPTNHMIPGTKILFNNEIAASELTRKNQFKKLNFT